MYGLFKQIHAQNVFEKEYSTLIYLGVNVNIGRVLYTDSPAEESPESPAVRGTNSCCVLYVHSLFRVTYVTIAS